mmetsp:Transcript_10396/g.12623  ORF Transcript_10396/g.12623 Transcript_10396/m.12623 type:complete len:212 (-) Transcript_10396:515-1150(-)
MTELGRGIDELEVNILESHTTGVCKKSLTESNDTLLDTDNTSTYHNPIFIHATIMRKSTHWGNTLFGKISLSRSRFGITFLSNTEDLFVNFSTMMVSILTSTCYGGGYTHWMPCTNTSYLTKTTMSLTWKTGNTPTGDNTFVSVTLGCTKNINIFILSENGVNSNFLFEKSLSEINLCCYITTINLYFHNVSLLLTETNFSSLGVCNNTNY